MKIKESNGNLIIESVTDFELCDVFDCGQCFRWERAGENCYEGVAKGKALLLEKTGDSLIFHKTTKDDFDNIWCDYFDFSRDYSEIKKTLSEDKILLEAISYGKGIRILKQDTFEALISFIISAGNNIPRIKGIINNLSVNFGEQFEYMGKTYYAFPTPDKLSSLTLEELSVIRAGFRDKFILSAAKAVATGELDIDALSEMTCRDAKKTLMQLSGVGDKVSDCILLFGLAKHDSFPIDVWIKRIMEYCYFDKQEQKRETISDFAIKQYGEYGGFAQQYLFFWARENKIGV